MTKLLFILNPEKPINRIIRRGVVIAILTFVSVVITDSLHLVPAVYVPILTGVLALVDKTLREYNQ